ncbi:hypothetical protein MVES_001563 [Malassezia vespertilionis]|uniref:Phospholipase/carboxylesterase/thioesterase domain-containing protein n=1 Tax=Malassezia vespertilionis TaxID=2020962 RepID=A0A2N1JDI9_9BASI|nr:hypothetical protein MVES_001563 [Malassezia vespertilionis]
MHVSSVLERRTRPKPTADNCARFGGACGAFAYRGALDGVDSNLVVLLHGLGDTAAPFASLGTSLQNALPQTVVLCLQGTRRVPFLEEDAWMWWDSFTPLGEPIAQPDPRAGIAVVQQWLAYLCAPEEEHGCCWPPERIHLLGFAQGGTLALETAIVERQHLQLGSIVSVQGPLLSLPTFYPALASPVCFVTRFSRNVVTSAERQQLAWLYKAYAHVTHHNIASQTDMHERMLQGPEWADIMRFWSPLWCNRSRMELDGQVYTVHP